MLTNLATAPASSQSGICMWPPRHNQHQRTAVSADLENPYRTPDPQNTPVEPTTPSMPPTTSFRDFVTMAIDDNSKYTTADRERQFPAAGESPEYTIHVFPPRGESQPPHLGSRSRSIP
ncbi:hypothetical protein FDECE_13482 [Fusarium decemcellulare]|nr:hypothetical protein FDECE_13482 [Fusarium decemcellulare]